jgi:hypothetical protein
MYQLLHTLETPKTLRHLKQNDRTVSTKHVHDITLWSRVRLDKLTVTKKFKNFPPLIPFLSQMNPVHALPPFLKLSSHLSLGLSSDSFLFRFTDQNFVRIYYRSRACYVAQLIPLITIIFGKTAQIMKLILNFSPAPCYCYLGSNKTRTQLREDSLLVY